MKFLIKKISNAVNNPRTEKFAIAINYLKKIDNFSTNLKSSSNLLGILLVVLLVKYRFFVLASINKSLKSENKRRFFVFAGPAIFCIPLYLFLQPKIKAMKKGNGPSYPGGKVLPQKDLIAFEFSGLQFESSLKTFDHHLLYKKIERMWDTQRDYTFYGHDFFEDFEGEILYKYSRYCNYDLDEDQMISHYVTRVLDYYLWYEECETVFLLIKHNRGLILNIFDYMLAYQLSYQEAVHIMEYYLIKYQPSLSDHDNLCWSDKDLDYIQDYLELNATFQVSGIELIDTKKVRTVFPLPLLGPNKGSYENSGLFAKKSYFEDVETCFAFPPFSEEELQKKIQIDLFTTKLKGAILTQKTELFYDCPEYLEFEKEFLPIFNEQIDSGLNFDINLVLNKYLEVFKKFLSKRLIEDVVTFPLNDRRLRYKLSVDQYLQILNYYLKKYDPYSTLDQNLCMFYSDYNILAPLLGFRLPYWNHHIDTRIAIADFKQEVQDDHIKYLESNPNLEDILLLFPNPIDKKGLMAVSHTPKEKKEPEDLFQLFRSSAYFRDYCEFSLNLPKYARKKEVVFQKYELIVERARLGDGFNKMFYEQVYFDENDSDSNDILNLEERGSDYSTINSPLFQQKDRGTGTNLTTNLYSNWRGKKNLSDPFPQTTEIAERDGLLKHMGKNREPIWSTELDTLFSDKKDFGPDDLTAFDKLEIGDDRPLFSSFQKRLETDNESLLFDKYPVFSGIKHPLRYKDNFLLGTTNQVQENSLSFLYRSSICDIESDIVYLINWYTDLGLESHLLYNNLDWLPEWIFLFFLPDKGEDSFEIFFPSYYIFEYGRKTDNKSIETNLRLLLNSYAESFWWECWAEKDFVDDLGWSTDWKHHWPEKNYDWTKQSTRWFWYNEDHLNFETGNYDFREDYRVNMSYKTHFKYKETIPLYDTVTWNNEKSFDWTEYDLELLYRYEWLNYRFGLPVDDIFVRFTKNPIKLLFNHKKETKKRDYNTLLTDLTIDKFFPLREIYLLPESLPSEEQQSIQQIFSLQFFHQNFFDFEDLPLSLGETVFMFKDFNSEVDGWSERQILRFTLSTAFQRFGPIFTFLQNLRFFEIPSYSQTNLTTLPQLFKVVFSYLSRTTNIFSFDSTFGTKKNNTLFQSLKAFRFTPKTSRKLLENLKSFNKKLNFSEDLSEYFFVDDIYSFPERNVEDTFKSISLKSLYLGQYLESLRALLLPEYIEIRDFLPVYIPLRSKPIPRYVNNYPVFANFSQNLKVCCILLQKRYNKSKEMKDFESFYRFKDELLLPIKWKRSRSEDYSFPYTYNSDHGLASCFVHGYYGYSWANYKNRDHVILEELRIRNLTLYPARLLHNLRLSILKTDWYTYSLQRLDLTRNFLKNLYNIVDSIDRHSKESKISLMEKVSIFNYYCDDLRNACLSYNRKEPMYRQLLALTNDLQGKVLDSRNVRNVRRIERKKKRRRVSSFLSPESFLDLKEKALLRRWFLYPVPKRMWGSGHIISGSAATASLSFNKHLKTIYPKAFEKRWKKNFLRSYMFKNFRNKTSTTFSSFRLNRSTRRRLQTIAHLRPIPGRDTIGLLPLITQKRNELAGLSRLEERKDQIDVLKQRKQAKKQKQKEQVKQQKLKKHKRKKKSRKILHYREMRDFKTSRIRNQIKLRLFKRRRSTIFKTKDLAKILNLWLKRLPSTTPILYYPDNLKTGLASYTLFYCLRVFLIWLSYTKYLYVLYFSIEYVRRFLKAVKGALLAVKKPDFRKERADTYTINKNWSTNFKDLAGIDNILPELWEILYTLKSPFLDRILVKRMDDRKGYLLVGPPGTGKTFLVKALAGQAKVPVIVESLGTILFSFNDIVTKSKSIRLNLTFARAKRNAPCILFIDEIDSIATNRKVLQYRSGNPIHDEILTRYLPGHQKIRITPKEVDADIRDYQYYKTKKKSARKRSYLQDLRAIAYTERAHAVMLRLLVEMDKLATNAGVVVIGATNRPHGLDPALIRPGRLSNVLNIKLPGKIARIEILKLYSKEIKKPDQDLVENISLQNRKFFFLEKMSRENLKKITEERLKKSLILPDLYWEYLGNITLGFSAADLAVVIKRSYFKALLQKTNHTIETIEEGIEYITTSKKSKKQIHNTTFAYYQAGRAVLHTLLPLHPDVNIIKLFSLYENSRLKRYRENINLAESRANLETRLIGLYAGKAAELLFLSLFPHTKKHIEGKNEPVLQSFLYRKQTTCGVEDLANASYLARFLVYKSRLYSNNIGRQPKTKIFTNKSFGAFTEKHDWTALIIRSKLSVRPFKIKNRFFSFAGSLKHKQAKGTQEFWDSKVAKLVKRIPLRKVKHKEGLWYRVHRFRNITFERIEIRPAVPAMFFHNELRFYTRNSDSVKLSNSYAKRNDDIKTRRYHFKKNSLSTTFSFKRFTNRQAGLQVEKKGRLNLLPKSFGKENTHQTKAQPVIWNDLNQLDTEYISQALIHICFNQAFCFLDENREVLDYLVDYSKQFGIVRQDKINEIFVCFGLPISDKIQTESELKNRQTIYASRKKYLLKDTVLGEKFRKKEKINEVFDKNWGKDSRRVFSRFFTFNQ